MSTNYYLNDTKGKTYHVGKASLGWQFLFDTADIKLNAFELPVDSFERWMDVIQTSTTHHGWQLEDEYGHPVSMLTLIARIMESQRVGINCWTDPDNGRAARVNARKSYDDGYFFDNRGFWFSKSRDFG